jgi:TRAP-type C4-dicarboxylate transport system permease small subunit
MSEMDHQTVQILGGILCAVLFMVGIAGTLISGLNDEMVWRKEFPRKVIIKQLAFGFMMAAGLIGLIACILSGG